jgi:hypothetical protein
MPFETFFRLIQQTKLDNTGVGDYKSPIKTQTFQNLAEMTRKTGTN